MSNRKTIKLIDASGKTCKVNVQDVKMIYPVDELIKYIPDDEAFGCAAKYHAHLKYVQDLHWSLNEKVLLEV